MALTTHPQPVPKLKTKHSYTSTPPLGLHGLSRVKFLLVQSFSLLETCKYLKFQEFTTLTFTVFFLESICTTSKHQNNSNSWIQSYGFHDTILKCLYIPRHKKKTPCIRGLSTTENKTQKCAVLNFYQNSIKYSTSQLVKKFTFNENQRFSLCSQELASIPYRKAGESNSSPFRTSSLISSLISLFCLYLVFQSVLFLGFPTSCYACLFFHMNATCPAYLILLDPTTWTESDEQHKLCNSIIFNFFHAPVGARGGARWLR
jgi:hypothetical protein